MNSALGLDWRVKAEDLFSGLNPENKQEQDKEFKFNNLSLAEIDKTFNKSYEEINKRTLYWGFLEIYEVCKKNINKPYTSEEISNFSKFLINYQNLHKLDSYRYIDGFILFSGIYLTTLINCSNDKKHIIDFTKFYKYPDYMGYENNGKEITINGNVGDAAGFRMNKGKLIINGTPGKGLGRSIRDGEIHVNGEIKPDCIYLEEINKGKIYHNGKLIIRNGRTGLLKWLPF